MSEAADVAYLRAHAWIVEPVPAGVAFVICQRLREQMAAGQLMARARRKRRGFCVPCAVALTRISEAAAHRD